MLGKTLEVIFDGVFLEILGKIASRVIGKNSDEILGEY